MRRMIPVTITTLVLSLLLTPLAFAAIPQGQEEQEEQEQEQSYEETVVVSASRFEQLLMDVPVSISVIAGEFIKNTASTGNYADLLRSVPGLNVTQTSARDTNMTSRQATSTLATSQLVMVDGRTVYQDFFGFVLWELLPVNRDELAQIEVQRGPSSAVWGANAMTGVVNVITKSPRAMGNWTSIRAGAGEIGTSFFSALQSGVRDKFSYKFSGAYYQQDPWPRPSNFSGAAFPDAVNRGTAQPKFDGRVDYQINQDSNLSFGGGYTGTNGIIFTGLGPFDIADGSSASYMRADYNNGDANVRFFANILDAESQNLLSPLILNFATGTYDFSAKNMTVAQEGKHVLNYGGNYRHLTNELSIAPDGDTRSEGGVYLQDNWAPHEQFLINAGVRLDTFSSIDGAVFTPRIGMQVRPFAGEDHAIRVSWGRGTRAPSVINNHLNTFIFNSLDLSPLTPVLGFNPGLFAFPIFAEGNPGLKQETHDQFEVGYRAVINGKVSLDFAYYVSETTDNIDFYTDQYFNMFDPPPGWALPGFILNFLPALPKHMTYRNIGSIKNQGMELGFQARVAPGNEIFANYTWQKDPEVEEIDLADVNLPPTNRFNVGMAGSVRGLMYSAVVAYQDEAFWSDVLDSRFHGVTDKMTTLNLTLGYELENINFSVRATNVTNQLFQQHYVGDVIGRRVVAEAGLNFDWDNR